MSNFVTRVALNTGNKPKWTVVARCDTREEAISALYFSFTNVLEAMGYKPNMQDECWYQEHNNDDIPFTQAPYYEREWVQSGRNIVHKKVTPYILFRGTVFHSKQQGIDI